MVEGYIKHSIELYPHWRELVPFAETATDALHEAGGSVPRPGNRTAIVDRFLATVEQLWSAAVASERQALIG
jgi:hypothetical protein